MRFLPSHLKVNLSVALTLWFVTAILAGVLVLTGR